MHKPIKYVEKAVTVAAGAAWFAFDKLNQINQNPSFTPAWSDKPLLKSYEKQKPTLGWPRETDSLCPRCVPEIRQQIVDGKAPARDPAQRKGGRNQSHHHRARRQDPDGEGVPQARPTSKTSCRSIRRSSSIWKTFFPAAISARTTTKSCTTTAPAPSSTGADRCSPST